MAFAVRSLNMVSICSSNPNDRIYRIRFRLVAWPRTNHAAENLNVLRKTALYFLRKTSVPEKRFGLSRKMFRATLSDDFPYDVLFGKVK
jgi:hypothetical protein